MVKLESRFAEPMKTLPAMLDEFRTALQDEIEVAKRNASNSAIPLSNGHKVGEQGSAFQYAFLIDSVLNTPDGAPGDLIVPERVPIEATIVSVEGLRIVISVETDLGQFVPSARLQADLSDLMRKLIERIESNASAGNAAGSRMMGTTPVTGSPKRPMVAPELLKAQMTALQSALGRNLTVIWGPPGTGKTYTIGTIAKCLHDEGRTVLIVSHTNTAVDQAIKRVASDMLEYLEQGAVIRVGEVRDDVLKSKYPDVLLRSQVERQSKSLVELRDKLVSQQQEVQIIEWVEASKSNIASCGSRIEELHKKQGQLTSAERTLSGLEKKHEQLIELRDHTSGILVVRNKLAAKKEGKSRLEDMLSLRTMECEEANRRVHQQERQIEIVNRITPLRQERATYPSMEEQKSIIETLSARIVEIVEQLGEIQQSHADAITILEQTRSTGAFMRLLKRLPRPEEQKLIVSSLSKRLKTLDAESIAVKEAYNGVRDKLGRIIELDSELSQYKAIGTYSEELEKGVQLKHALRSVERIKAEIESDIERVCNEIEQLETEENRYTKTFNGDPKDVYLKVCSQLKEHEESQESVKSLDLRISEMRKSISLVLSPMLVKLLEWGMVSDVPSACEEMQELVRESHGILSEKHATADLPALRKKVESLRSEIVGLAVEIERIDERLEKVEQEIISNASVVGATLTKTYLSDDIQARKFDTVILDEASMAPIPALWVAALLSEKNLIIVGDFKQLPPIVLSKNDLTKKWLGRDIFEASGLKALWAKGSLPDYFVQLNEQRRMLPQIAQVANEFYGGSLRTSPDPPEGLEKFREWYNTDWRHDQQVVLVDTGKLNAWVTSVMKNGNASRLNFLSAIVAVDLAEQLLLPDRPKIDKGAPMRILVATPYRAQAKLLSLLLRENDQMQDEVIAGTVHSFQGSEADVVIFDLVADEPHWRVNLFMPSLDEQIESLLNVGLTRAKFRLFILGDFSYCGHQGKKAFLGRKLLPFLLKSFPRVDASKLFPEGLAARAAKAQMTMLGGEIEPDSARVVITQADFFRVLSSDLARAKSRIVVYSPFMTQDRVSFLMPQLQAACMRGVDVLIITKSQSERPKHELAQIKRMEEQLSRIGVIVCHKMRMHEKLVFVDEDITWAGSLNPLSFSNTQEVMERRKSKAVLDDYFNILRLQDLIKVQGNVESKCPICGSEIVAAEGADEPYYWRCVNDGCYSRSIDQPYPFDGVITCRACNSRVELGYWGDYPHWRCTLNSRHRQRVFKSHIRLPKMASLIPKQERRKICKILGIDDFDKHVLGSQSEVSKTIKQISLFDELKE